MLYQLSYTRPFKLRIANCGLMKFAASAIKSAIRIPKSAIHLVQGVGFEPT